jgi:hypothetical protein
MGNFSGVSSQVFEKELPMLISLRSVRKAAAGAIGAGALTGAMLFSGIPAAQAAPPTAPGTTFAMHGPYGAPVPARGGWGGGGHAGGHSWGHGGGGHVTNSRTLSWGGGKGGHVGGWGRGGHGYGNHGFDRGYGHRGFDRGFGHHRGFDHGMGHRGFDHRGFMPWW